MNTKHIKHLALCTVITTSLTTITTPTAWGQETQPTTQETTQTTTTTTTQEPTTSATPTPTEHENQPTETPHTPTPVEHENQPTETPLATPETAPPSIPTETSPTQIPETLAQGDTPPHTTTQQNTTSDQTTHTTTQTTTPPTPDKGITVETPQHDPHNNDTQNGADPGDADNDGIPDEWETQGIILDDGTKMPLQHWGSQPDKQDLYLQVNWMKSEWKTLGCDESNAKANTEECKTANTKSYRPETQTFDDLTHLFSEHNINLHIDAGDYYTNIPNYTTRYGGETLDYQRYYFNDGTTRTNTLTDTSDLLLGDREKIFHVCVIGDQTEPGKYTSGVGMVEGNAFFVANSSRMHTEEQVRNTILHELGHNLGLEHAGPAHHAVNAATQNGNADYTSVMNYTYQWDTFNYSENPYTTLNTQGNPITIPADWDSLIFQNYLKGKGDVTIGAELTAQDKQVSQDNMNKQKSLQNHAKLNNTANITNINTTPDSVTFDVTNLGLDIAKYIVSITTAGKHTTDTLTLGGAQEKTHATTLTYDLPKGNTSDVEIEVHNPHGFTTTQTVKQQPVATPTQITKRTSTTAQTTRPEPKPAPKPTIVKTTPPVTHQSVKKPETQHSTPNIVAIAIGSLTAITLISALVYWLYSITR